MTRPISKAHLLRIDEFEKYGFIEPHGLCWTGCAHDRKLRVKRNV